MATKGNTEQSGSKVKPLLEPGTQLCTQYSVRQLIGIGTFGQVFRGLRQGGGEVAIKAAKIDETTRDTSAALYNEACCLDVLNHMIYKRFSAEGTKTPIPLYMGYGKLGSIHYIVMELCGKDMSVLKRRTAYNRFSINASLWMLKKMISALQFLHELGFIHRDVKPGNFCLRFTRNGEPHLYLIDFGMARYYRTSTGELKARRPVAHFHGTVRYASLVAHRHQDMSRFDDLWPVYYITVENMVGYLPWGYVTDRDEVRTMKEAATLHKLKFGEEREPPRSLVLFCEHLREASFYAEPAYQLFRDTIDADLVQRNFSVAAMLDSRLAPITYYSLDEETRGNYERIAVAGGRRPQCGDALARSDNDNCCKTSYYAMDELSKSS